MTLQVHGQQQVMTVWVLLSSRQAPKRSFVETGTEENTVQAYLSEEGD